MKILIADDHDLVAHALSALLTGVDPAIVTRHANDLPDALELMRSEGEFEAVLLDFRMPGMNGLQGVGAMVDAAGDIPVIVMSGSVTSSQVRAAMERGARGFIPKTLAGPSLINALRLIISGETYVPTAVLDGASGEADAAMAMGLTPREKEVLHQLRLGGSNKEIANALDIAETTVKLHLRSVSEKISAKNRTDIIVRAFELGLLE